MSAKRISARRAGAAAARQSLRQFDREIAAMDKQAVKSAKAAPVVEQVPATEMVSRPAEIKTVSFEMGGKQYRTRSSWDLLG